VLDTVVRFATPRELLVVTRSAARIASRNRSARRRSSNFSSASRARLHHSSWPFSRRNLHANAPFSVDAPFCKAFVPGIWLTRLAASRARFSAFARSATRSFWEFARIARPRHVLGSFFDLLLLATLLDVPGSAARIASRKRVAQSLRCSVLGIAALLGSRNRSSARLCTCWFCLSTRLG
jgi:hypothetical protein